MRVNRLRVILFVGLVIALVAAFVGTATAQGTDWSTLIEQAKPAVVWIIVETSEGTFAGSGAIISPNGYILTAGHVVKGANKITVVVEESKEYSATIVNADYDMDVALLKIPASGLTWLALGDSDKVRYDEEIQVLGYPLPQQGVGYIAVAGKVQGFRTYKDVTLIQHNAPTEAGHSGGPVINSQGEIIAVHTSWIGGKHSKYTIGVAINSVKLIIPSGVLPSTPSPVQPATGPAAHVGPIHVPQDYSTIQAAVQAAGAGAEIQVARGTYRGDLLIGKTIKIVGEEGTVIQGNVSIQGVESINLGSLQIRGELKIQDSQGVSLSSLVIEGSRSVGLLIEGSTVMATECRVEKSGTVGVDISFRAQVALRDCEVVESSADGIHLSFSAQLRVVNTTVKKSGEDGIEIIDSTAELTDNRFLDNAGYGIHAHSGAQVTGERNRGDGNGLGFSSAEVPLAVASIRVPQEMSIDQAMREAGQVPVLLSPGRYKVSDLQLFRDVSLRGTGADPTACVIVAVNGWRISERGHLQLENLALNISGEERLEVQGRLTASGVVFQGGGVKVKGEAQASFNDCQISGSSFLVTESARVALNGCTSGTSSFSVNNSAQLILTGCTISGTGNTGLSVADSAQASLANCTISDYNSGLYAEDSARITLTDCQVSANDNYGLYISGSARATLTGCQVFANDNDGLCIDSSARVTVANSYIYANKAGIFLREKTKAQVEINQTWISLNNFGIELKGGEVVGEGNWVLDNLKDFSGYSPGPGFMGTESPKIPWLLEDRVEVCPNCKVDSLALAVAGVRPGGTVYIRAGTYHGIRITSKNLTLLGEGPGKTIVTDLVVGGQVAVKIADSQLSGDHGLMVEGSTRVTLTECTISGGGIRLRNSAQVALTECTVSGNKDSGVDVLDSAQVTLTGCTVSGNEYGLEVGNSARAVLIGNRFLNNRVYGIGVWSTEAQVTGRNNEMRGNGCDLVGNVPASVRVPLASETTRTELSVPGDYPTLQEAVDAIAPGGTITLAPGTYETGLTIWKSVTIRGAGRDQTVLQSPEGTWLGVSVIAGVSGVVVEKLSVRRSKADSYLVILGQVAFREIGNPFLQARGSAQVTLTDCTFSGLYAKDSARVTFTDCTISERSGLSSRVEDSAQVALTECTVSGNKDGGIHVWDSAQVTLTGCTVSGNLYGLEVGNSARAVLIGNRFLNNRVYGIGVWSTEAQVTGRNNEMRGNGCDLVGNVPASVRVPLASETTRTELSVPGDYPTLQEAVDAIAPGGTITLAPGTYETGLTIWKSVTIRGAGRDQTVLQSPEGTWLGVSVIAGVSGVVVEEMSVRRAEFGLEIFGQAELRQLDILAHDGIGVKVVGSAQVIINDCTISEDEKGILVTDLAQVTLIGCTVSKSEWAGLEMQDSTRVTLTECTISGNDTFGLRVWDSAQVALTDCNITGQRGDGILVSQSTQVTLTECTVSGNKDGGINVNDSAQVTLTGCTISGNGDGILVYDVAWMKVRNCVISDNSEWGVTAALRKCGTSSRDDFNGQVVLENNKISRNGKGDVCLPNMCDPSDACR